MYLSCAGTFGGTAGEAIPHLYIVRSETARVVKNVLLLTLKFLILDPCLSE